MFGDDDNTTASMSSDVGDICDSIIRSTKNFRLPRLDSSGNLQIYHSPLHFGQEQPAEPPRHDCDLADDFQGHSISNFGNPQTSSRKTKNRAVSCSRYVQTIPEEDRFSPPTSHDLNVDMDEIIFDSRYSTNEASDIISILKEITLKANQANSGQSPTNLAKPLVLAPVANPRTANAPITSAKLASAPVDTALLATPSIPDPAKETPVSFMKPMFNFNEDRLAFRSAMKMISRDSSSNSGNPPSRIGSSSSFRDYDMAIQTSTEEDNQVLTGSQITEETQFRAVFRSMSNSVNLTFDPKGETGNSIRSNQVKLAGEEVKPNSDKSPGPSATASTSAPAPAPEEYTVHPATSINELIAIYAHTLNCYLRVKACQHIKVDNVVDQKEELFGKNYDTSHFDRISVVQLFEEIKNIICQNIPLTPVNVRKDSKPAAGKGEKKRAKKGKGKRRRR